MDMWFNQGDHFGFQPAPWDFLFQPLNQQPFQTAYTPQYSYARSTGSSTVRYARGSSWREGGCTVASIATVAKVSYETAREKAVEIGGFDGDGLSFSDAEKVLASLGVSATRYDQGNDWSEIPDLAIVTVNHPTGIPHAVVFRRKNGQELIYDHGWVAPRSVGTNQSNFAPYQLYDGQASYIEIHK